MFNRGLAPRVDKLEERFTTLGASVDELRADVGGLGGKIDRLADGLSNTGERAAQRAHAVKVEMRDETDRKAKERGEWLKGGLGLLGGVALVVAALTGPSEV
jgi:hypothetical protein